MTCALAVTQQDGGLAEGGLAEGGLAVALEPQRIHEETFSSLVIYMFTEYLYSLSPIMSDIT